MSAQIPTEHAEAVSRLPEYNSWRAMLARCNNKQHPRYAGWGGKGVAVCERWHDFAAFRADMGPKPTGRFSIDRIDNARGYEPGNCRWASDQEQSENRPSFNRALTRDGRTQSLSAWAREFGVSRDMVKYRLDTGWDLGLALTTPSGALRKDNQTGVRGVSPFRGKFRARINVDGRTKHLGLFATVEEAASVVADAGGGK